MSKLEADERSLVFTDSAVCLIPDRLFDGNSILSDAGVVVLDGKVSGVVTKSKAYALDLPTILIDGLLCPGFIDIQVNGGGGYMFNNSPTSGALAEIGKKLFSAGTTSWLPTFITDSVEKMTLAAEAIKSSFGRNGVVGVHFEGPHISHSKRGAHRSEFIRPIDDSTLSILSELVSLGIPVLLTVAPECLPAGTISKLRNIGVLVSLGHTSATYGQVQVALSEGATCFTHLFNGMTPMSSRDPGVVGAALDSDAWCGFIADGHHVADSVLRIAIRSRPSANKMILVSDAMATTHGPSEFQLYGETISVVDGRLVNSAGSLAGAYIDMMGSVCRLILNVGIDPEVALRMATRNPAEFLGLNKIKGFVGIGSIAEFVVISDAWSLNKSLTFASVNDSRLSA